MPEDIIQELTEALASAHAGRGLSLRSSSIRRAVKELIQLRNEVFVLRRTQKEPVVSTADFKFSDRENHERIITATLNESALTQLVVEALCARAGIPCTPAVNPKVLFRQASRGGLTTTEFQAEVTLTLVLPQEDKCSSEPK